MYEIMSRKHIHTFESFLNEWGGTEKPDILASYDKYKDSLDIKLSSGPVNLHPKGTPPEWMNRMVTDADMVGDKGFISDVIDVWKKQSRGRIDTTLTKFVEEKAEEFFNKSGYINGNIIYAIIDQNSK